MSVRRTYSFGDFRLEPHERRLLHQERRVPLPAKAFDTLLVLVERSGGLVTKDELLRRVWPNSFVEENNLMQQVSLLRRILAPDANSAPLIETVPRHGYRFVGSVTARTEDDPGPGETATADPAASEVPDAESVAGGVAAREASDAGEVTDGGGRGWARGLVWALLLVLVGAIATGVWLWRPRDAGDAAMIRIAVLPFATVGEGDDAGIAAGLGEEVGARLAGLGRFSIPSATTLAAYDRRGKDVGRVGADLGVAYLLEGRVRRSEAAAAVNFRITPRLVRVADDTIVWASHYDVTSAELETVLADIARQVATALRVSPAESAEPAGAAGGTAAQPEAYLAYLRGLAAFRLGEFDTANQIRARAEFEQAVAQDPQFAAAWAWLGRVYIELYRTGTSPTPQTRRAARDAADTAVRLAPDSIEARLGRAHVLIGDGQVAEARTELDAVRARRPNLADTWLLIGYVDELAGEWTSALGAYLHAFDLDPVSAADRVALQYLFVRDWAEAKRYLAIARAANRTGAVVPEAWIRFSSTGDIAGARHVLEADLSARTPPDARAVGLLARLEWFDGRHQRALDLIQSMDAAGAWLSPSFRFPASLAAAQVYEDMGDQSQAESGYAAALADLQGRAWGLPDEHGVEAAQGLALSGLHRHDEALAHIDRALRLVRGKNARRAALYAYFLAQVQARAGRLDEALASLDELFRGPGGYSVPWVRRDPWLRALRSHPDFGKHVAWWTTSNGHALFRHRDDPLDDVARRSP